jgi:hypothetical protein
VKRFSVFRDALCHFGYCPLGLKPEQRHMFALLIAVGALFLAVAVSAVIDPWPSGTGEAGDGLPTMEVITLPV